MTTTIEIALTNPPSGMMAWVAPDERKRLSPSDDARWSLLYLGPQRTVVLAPDPAGSLFGFHQSAGKFYTRGFTTDAPLFGKVVLLFQPWTLGRWVAKLPDQLPPPRIVVGRKLRSKTPPPPVNLRDEPLPEAIVPPPKKRDYDSANDMIIVRRQGELKRGEILIARALRDLMQRLGEPVPEEIVQIAASPTWGEPL